nr:DUF4193 domain-containing protein [Motilibacter aurantiacus]
MTTASGATKASGDTSGTRSSRAYTATATPPCSGHIGGSSAISGNQRLNASRAGDRTERSDCACSPGHGSAKSTCVTRLWHHPSPTTAEGRAQTAPDERCWGPRRQERPRRARHEGGKPPGGARTVATDYDTPRKTDDEVGEDSIEELKARRQDKGASTVDVDEADLAESLELPGADLSNEELSVRVLPRQADEFTCSRCFLVHHRSQLAKDDGVQLVCKECAA